jgi:hypothetical protein
LVGPGMLGFPNLFQQVSNHCIPYKLLTLLMPLEGWSSARDWDYAHCLLVILALWDHARRCNILDPFQSSF